MGGAGIEQILSPISELAVQWRSADEHLWVVPRTWQRMVGEPGDRWQQWTGSDAVNTACAPITGSPTLTWWAVWGQHDGRPVDVDLAGTVPAHVRMIGKIWVAEWTGARRQAHIRRGDRYTDIEFAPPTLATAPTSASPPRKSTRPVPAGHR
ncbi:hypothetical protein ACFROC_19170 [Nocardia tengchongensis]|uniref:hypothetical protein n=1 Tax=Nocardia tengchongensis TaxID=2055889 RepID=UPI0036C00152